MSTDLDDAGDRAVDRRKDERAAFVTPALVAGIPWWMAREAPASVRLDRDETWTVPEAVRCQRKLCGRVLPPEVAEVSDECFPDCPEGDENCDIPACSDASHAGCETDTDRYTREREADELAAREQRTDWEIDERRVGER